MLAAVVLLTQVVGASRTEFRFIFPPGLKDLFSLKKLKVSSNRLIIKIQTSLQQYNPKPQT